METTLGEQTIDMKQEKDEWVVKKFQNYEKNRINFCNVSREENNIKNFLVELDRLRGLLADVESKLGLISTKCVKYFDGNFFGEII